MGTASATWWQASVVLLSLSHSVLAVLHEIGKSPDQKYDGDSLLTIVTPGYPERMSESKSICRISFIPAVGETHDGVEFRLEVKDFESSEVKVPPEPPIPECSYMLNVYNMIDMEAQTESYCSDSYPSSFILKDQDKISGKPVMQIEFLQQREQGNATGRLKYTIKAQKVDSLGNTIALKGGLNVNCIPLAPSPIILNTVRLELDPSGHPFKFFTSCTPFSVQCNDNEEIKLFGIQVQVTATSDNATFCDAPVIKPGHCAFELERPESVHQCNFSACTLSPVTRKITNEHCPFSMGHTYMHVKYQCMQDNIPIHEISESPDGTYKGNTVHIMTHMYGLYTTQARSNCTLIFNPPKGETSQSGYAFIIQIVEFVTQVPKSSDASKKSKECPYKLFLYNMMARMTKEESYCPKEVRLFLEGTKTLFAGKDPKGDPAIKIALTQMTQGTSAKLWAKVKVMRWVSTKLEPALGHLHVSCRPEFPEPLASTMAPEAPNSDPSAPVNSSEREFATSTRKVPVSRLRSAKEPGNGKDGSTQNSSDFKEPAVHSRLDGKSLRSQSTHQPYEVLVDQSDSNTKAPKTPEKKGIETVVDWFKQLQAYTSKYTDYIYGGLAALFALVIALLICICWCRAKCKKPEEGSEEIVDQRNKFKKPN